jgi:hypothetical protein
MPSTKIGSTDYKKWEDVNREISDDEEDLPKPPERAFNPFAPDRSHIKEKYEVGPTEFRLSEAHRHKDLGNEEFKAGNMEAAASHYQDGLDQLEYTYIQKPNEQDQYLRIRIDIHNNMSAVQLKLGDTEKAFRHAEMVT